jgi:hypothetical protein
MFKNPSWKWLPGALAVCSAVLLSACQRHEATPGVAGGTASAPSSPATGRVETPTADDSQVGAGKSPGLQGPAAGSRPEGMSGSGGTAPTGPASAPEPSASGLPAIPPPAAPGTAAPTPSASAPGS